MGYRRKNTRGSMRVAAQTGYTQAAYRAGIPSVAVLLYRASALVLPARYAARNIRTMYGCVCAAMLFLHTEHQ
ncbi:MAG: hypothetical protein Ta2A_05070 [Treponemataceae bacterium]|nr:MAG: hypothetical protein Ta2A_05070 [Treponemataceae bacterium]